MTPPELSDLYRARRAISGLVRRTPLVRSLWLSELAGADVRLKLECLQETASFKIRGALWASVRVQARAVTTRAGGAGDRPGVVTASAGNHGLALAEAALATGLHATVFTPLAAPRTKLEAIRRRGADLRAVATDYDDAERQALEFAASEGAEYISPYNHPDVIAGAGTVGLEILEDEPDTEVVVVPVGGGGLISGVATAVKSIRPMVRVIGVEAALNPAFTTSLAAGRVTRIPVQATIADGLGGNIEADSLTFSIAQRVVDAIVTVSEAELRTAIRELLRYHRVVAEGAGVPAVAALLTGKVDVRGSRTAAIVSGSNIDFGVLASVVAEGGRESA